MIASDPKPDVLVVHSPDLNSYVKLFKRAQKEGIYVVLIDNPTNFAADAFIGSDWDRLGQLEAEAVVKALRRRIRRRRSAWCRATRSTRRASINMHGIMKVLKKYPDFKVVAKPISNWDPTTARNVTTTMLQQNPDICAHHRFLGRRRHGAAAAIRDAGKEGKIVPGHHGRRRKGRLRQARRRASSARW